MTSDRKVNRGVKAAIDAAGSLRALGKMCEVSSTAVFKWLHIHIPAERAIQVEAKTGVPRSTLRPDLWQ